MKSTFVNSYVISTYQYGESDLIVSLFSVEKGKIKAIAKGAKRSKKRFVNVFEPFSLIKAEVITPKYGGELYLLKDAVLINNSSSIAKDPLSFTYASLALELVELWTKEEDKNPDIFWLMKWFFKMLVSNVDEDLIRLSLFFQIKILILAGYYPNIEKCLRCAEISSHGVPIKAIVLEDCNFCNKLERDQSYRLSLGTLQTFLKICRWDLRHILRIKMSKDIMLECWLLIIELHHIHLNSIPHSYYVLRELDSFWQEIFKIITI